MQLIILGKNTDDKGTQFEKLTMALLEKLGYKNAELSHIGSGGLEIDVVALYEMPSLAGNTNHRVLIECKAHNNPVNTTDWLKFIGKVTVEEIKRGTNIHGCLLALNGANGNARGIYEDIRERKPNIQLLSGQDLHHTLFEQYNICSQEKVSIAISQLTSRRTVTYSICFYEGKFAWAIQFEDDCFAVFDSKGDSPITNEDLMVKLIESNTSFGKPIDLLQEQHARNRHKLAISLIINYIVVKNGNFSIKEIIKEIPKLIYNQTSCAEHEIITDTELKNAIQELSTQGVININDDIISLPLPLTVSFYQKLFEGNLYISCLSSDLYKSSIDEKLLTEICKLQGGLVLSTDNKEKALFLIKYSPSALRLSLLADPMLINGLNHDRTPIMDEHFEQYFLGLLSDKFLHDFSQQILSQYYHDIVGSIETEKTSTIKIKSKNSIMMELFLKNRHAIMPVAESIGGGLIHISLINDAQEPWEI